MAVTNEKEFREWLAAQSRETCVAIAYRAAMRVLPLATTVDGGQEVAEERALAALRACLSAVVWMNRPNDRTGIALRSAAAVARESADSAGDFLEVRGFFGLRDVGAVGQVPARENIRLALHSAASFATASSTREIEAVAAAVEDAATAIIEVAYATPDDRDPEANVGSKAIFSEAQWDSTLPSTSVIRGSINVPEEVSSSINAWTKHRVDLLRSGGPWTFWTTWYTLAWRAIRCPGTCRRRLR